MVWDFAVIYMSVSLAIAGWHLGLVNSWPAPIAMILATSVAQFLYVNAGAYLMDGTRLPGDLAFLTAYIIIWVLLEGFFEMVLLALIPIKKEYYPNRPSRVAGAVIGMSKAWLVLVFATTASVSAMNMPSPPQPPTIATWFTDTARESALLRGSRRVASHMPNALTQRIISEDSPAFAPTFEDQSVVKVDQRRAKKWRELFEGLKNLQDEIQQL